MNDVTSFVSKGSGCMRGNSAPHAGETESCESEDRFVRKRRRGRPSSQNVKNQDRESESDNYEADSQDEEEIAEKTVRSKRGRPRKLKLKHINICGGEAISLSKRSKERPRKCVSNIMVREQSRTSRN